MEEQLAKNACRNGDLNTLRILLESGVDATGLLTYASTKEIIEELVNESNYNVFLNHIEKILSQLTYEDYNYVKQLFDVTNVNIEQIIYKALKIDNIVLVEKLIPKLEIINTDLIVFIAKKNSRLFNQILEEDFDLEEILEQFLVISLDELNAESFIILLEKVGDKSKWITIASNNFHFECTIKAVEKYNISNEIIAKNLFLVGYELHDLRLPSVVYSIIKRVDFIQAYDYIKKSGEYSEYIAYALYIYNNKLFNEKNNDNLYLESIKCELLIKFNNSNIITISF